MMVHSMEVHTVLSTSNIYMLELSYNPTNIYMISDIIAHVKYFFKKTKQQHPHVDDVILKSALVYQYIYFKNCKAYMTIDEVLEENNGEIGLIGPGNGRITRFLERIFKRSNILHSHSILHDAFGRFYSRYSSDRGYTYAIPSILTPTFIKRSPLCGQISGLLYCVSNKIVV